jgi:hypothetical protein
VRLAGHPHRQEQRTVTLHFCSSEGVEATENREAFLWHCNAVAQHGNGPCSLDRVDKDQQWDDSTGPSTTHVLITCVSHVVGSRSGSPGETLSSDGIHDPKKPPLQEIYPGGGSQCWDNEPQLTEGLNQIIVLIRNIRAPAASA